MYDSYFISCADCTTDEIIFTKKTGNIQYFLYDLKSYPQEKRLKAMANKVIPRVIHNIHNIHGRF